MTFIKYALPLLAVSHLAFAQCGNSTGTTVIQSQGDADNLQSCSTVKGDVEIDVHYFGSLTFNGIQQIVGSLKCTGASNLSAINAPSLNSIGQAFDLQGLTTLTTLSLGSLTKVGSINWIALPNLQTLSFSHGVRNATNVNIQNTGLTNLNGISLDSVDEFQVNDNSYLSTVNVNNLKKSTGIIVFAGNYGQLQIDLPNLSSAGNLTFRNVSSVNVPSLKTAAGQVGFFGDTLSTFSAPNLTETGDIVFIDNPQLSNISMNNLKTVNGGFQISSNPKLLKIDFPSLATVVGAVDFSGSFDDVQLPAISNVEGAFNLQSRGNFSCAPFDSDRSKGTIIKGNYECKASTSNPTTAIASGTKSGSASTSTSSKGAAVNNIANMPAMGMAAVFGAILAL